MREYEVLLLKPEKDDLSSSSEKEEKLSTIDETASLEGQVADLEQEISELKSELTEAAEERDRLVLIGEEKEKAEKESEELRERIRSNEAEFEKGKVCCSDSLITETNCATILSHMASFERYKIFY